MLHRNIDFFALFFIVLGLVAFAKLPAMGRNISLPPAPQPIHFQNAMASDSCPLKAEVLARLEQLLNP